MIWPAQAEWHGSEELAPIVRLCWSELSRDGTLVQFPRRRARLARRNHLIRIDMRQPWSRSLQMFRRRPFVAIIIDVEFDAVVVRVLVIECRL